MHIVRTRAHTQARQETPPPRPQMFPLLSSQIVEFIAEKVRRRFLLLEPDVSSRCLPVCSFWTKRVGGQRRGGGGALYIVLWPGDLAGIFFFFFFQARAF